MGLLADDTNPRDNIFQPSNPVSEPEGLQPPSPIVTGDGAAYDAYNSSDPSTVTAPVKNDNISIVGTTPVDPVEPYAAEQVASSNSGGYLSYTPETVAEGTGQGAAVTGAVDESATVEGRLSGLLSRNSDYMKLAETASTQASNRKGLLNSSMAVGAGRKAAIEAALPIAQQDASTFASMEQSNLQYENQMSQFNAQQEMVLEQFNKGEINQAERDNALADIQDRQFNAELEFNASSLNATATNQASQFNSELLLKANMFNSEQGQEAAMANMQAYNDASTAFTAEMNKQSFANLSTSLNGWLAELDGQIAFDLAEMEHKFNIAENIDSVNGAVYQELTRSISNIMANTEDPEEAAAKISLAIKFAGVDYAYMNIQGIDYAKLGDQDYTNPTGPDGEIIPPEDPTSNQDLNEPKLNEFVMLTYDEWAKAVGYTKSSTWGKQYYDWYKDDFKNGKTEIPTKIG